MPVALTHGDLFSGIGGFSLAAERAGIRTLWHSEIDPYASAVLRKHWPATPNYGDIREMDGAAVEPVDIITAGFPCQDLSVAGRRAGLAGERSGLYFEIIRLVREMRDATDGRFPAFVVLENVPGLLSSHGGRDFAVVLRELRELGALDIGWRVLDAQHFGVPQRRRRVFVVADLGADRAGQILFERHGSEGHSAPCREARAAVASAVRASTANRGTDDPDRITYVAAPLTAGSNPHSNAAGRRREDDENLVAFDTTQVTSTKNYSNPKPGDPCHPLAAGAHPPAIAHRLTAEGHDTAGTDIMPTMPTPSASGGGHPPAVAVALRGREGGATAELSDIPSALRASQGGGDKAHVLMPTLEAGTNRTGGTRPPGTTVDTAETLIPNAMAVRRLMPVECLRLQGFPDDHLDVEPELSDSAKYRCVGNAVAVPVVEWLLRRIVMLDAAYIV